MFAALTILVLALSADDTKAGDLVPIEQGSTDRSVTATSLRIQPVELSQSTNFQKLFGIAGRPDLFVRSQGGLYAVFDQGSYRTVYGQHSSKTFVQWPAGTTFHIGQPDFAGMKPSMVRMDQKGANPPPGIQLPQKVSGDRDERIGAAPVDGLVRVVPLNNRVVAEPADKNTPSRVPVKDAGFGHHSLDPQPRASAQPAPAVPTTEAPAKESPAPAEATAPAKDVPAQTPPKP